MILHLVIFAYFATDLSCFQQIFEITISKHLFQIEFDDFVSHFSGIVFWPTESLNLLVIKPCFMTIKVYWLCWFKSFFSHLILSLSWVAVTTTYEDDMRACSLWRMPRSDFTIRFKLGPNYVVCSYFSFPALSGLPPWMIISSVEDTVADRPCLGDGPSPLILILVHVATLLSIVSL